MIKSLCCLCLVMAGLKAQEVSNAEILNVSTNLVHVISSFDEVDYFSTYSHSGEFIWETPFHSHILSWKTENDDLIFIFSKNRNGLVFYLTCIEKATGKLVWEKSIFAPNKPSS